MSDAIADALRPIVATLVEEALASRSETPDRLLTIEQAAEALAISRTRMYAEMNAGRVRTVRSGRRRLVPASAIPEAIERMAAEVTS
jgi:excisionase family DNA binding protein